MITIPVLKKTRAAKGSVFQLPRKTIKHLQSLIKISARVDQVLSTDPTIVVVVVAGALQVLVVAIIVVVLCAVKTN